MTPKEKAFELVKIFNPHTEVHRIPIYHAKKCALIAVDEILNTVNNLFNTYSQNDYWLQVKQEIEKI